MKNLVTSKTKCLLVYPEFSKFSSLNYVDVCEIIGAKYPTQPLGLLTVAALLPQHWQFKLIDINVEPLLDEHFDWADIICTGGMISQQPGIHAVIKKAHQLNKKVIVGGPEPTSQPTMYEIADYLVLGEGENTIPDLLEDLRNNIPVGVYKAVELADLNKSVVPRFDLIKFADYLMMGLQFSRGCPYNCEYCNVIELFGKKPRTKSTKQVISELQSIYDFGYRGHIFFVDDNLFGSRKSIEELLRAIKNWSIINKYPFYFGAEATINLADDDKLLKMVRDVDFRYLSIGIETPEDEILAMTQKHQNVNKPITQIVKKIYSYGIVVDASFILGFDNENNQTADKMIDCIQDAGICMAMVGTLTSLPNTQLEQRLKSEGRLFEEGTTIKDNNIKIDQMSSGLNFITKRPRIDILKDYVKIIESIYNPVNYYKRLTLMGLSLKRDNKHKPEFIELLNILKAFYRVCLKIGFNKTTGKLFWELFITILFRNPKALELSVGMATMFIHFYKHSQFIINLTNNKIKDLEKSVPKKYS